MSRVAISSCVVAAQGVRRLLFHHDKARAAAAPHAMGPQLGLAVDLLQVVDDASARQEYALVQGLEFAREKGAAAVVAEVQVALGLALVPATFWGKSNAIS